MSTIGVDLGQDWISVPQDTTGWVDAVAATPLYDLPRDQRAFLQIARTVAGARCDERAFARLLHVPTRHMVAVVTDLFALPARGEPEQTLPALISVGAPDRGPRTPEVVTAGGGATYRSIGALPAQPGRDGTALEFVCLHALRRGRADIVARTSLGPAPFLVPEIIGAIETMLASVVVTAQGAPVDAGG